LIKNLAVEREVTSKILVFDGRWGEDYSRSYQERSFCSWFWFVGGT